jgi:hypothetical protein
MKAANQVWDWKSPPNFIPLSSARWKTHWHICCSANNLMSAVY